MGSNFYESEFSGIYIVAAGSNIDSTIKKAIATDIARQMTISFDFNDVIVVVEAASNS